VDRIKAAALAALLLSSVALAGEAFASTVPSADRACTPTPANSTLCDTGAVTPILELPGGSDQRSPNTAQAVLGVQTGPARSVQGLPSTSTDNDPSFPLAALGLAITALGGALLRRRDTPS
jgi:LPXTG-motif cell wall-anchored protein